jgi:hypothetical protein
VDYKLREKFSAGCKSEEKLFPERPIPEDIASHKQWNSN